MKSVMLPRCNSKISTPSENDIKNVLSNKTRMYLCIPISNVLFPHKNFPKWGGHSRRAYYLYCCNTSSHHTQSLTHQHSPKLIPFTDPYNRSPSDNILQSCHHILTAQSPSFILIINPNHLETTILHPFHHFTIQSHDTPTTSSYPHYLPIMHHLKKRTYNQGLHCTSYLQPCT